MDAFHSRSSNQFGSCCIHSRIWTLAPIRRPFCSVRRVTHAIEPKRCTTSEWQFQFCSIFCVALCPTASSRRTWRHGWLKWRRFMCAWLLGRITYFWFITYSVVRLASHRGQLQSFRFQRRATATPKIRCPRHSPALKSIIALRFWKCCWCRRNSEKISCPNWIKRTRQLMLPTTIYGSLSIRMAKKIILLPVSAPHWRKVIWLLCSIRCRSSICSVAWHSRIGTATNAKLMWNE